MQVLFDEGVVVQERSPKRSPSGADKNVERHISQFPKFREKVGLAGRKRPRGSRCVTTPLTTPFDVQFRGIVGGHGFEEKLGPAGAGWPSG